MILFLYKQFSVLFKQFLLISKILLEMEEFIMEKKTKTNKVFSAFRLDDKYRKFLKKIGKGNMTKGLLFLIEKVFNKKQ